MVGNKTARSAKSTPNTPKSDIVASELSYRRLFESARDGILILEFETGRITDANPFMVELLGFSLSEMLGKTVGALSSSKDLIRNQSILKSLQADGFVRYEDVPLQTKSHKKIQVEFVSNVYLADKKKIIQCNIRDIRQRKQEEEVRRKTESRFRRLVDSNAQGILFWNTNGEITDANDAFLNMVQYTRADLKAGIINWKNLTPSEYVELDRICLQKMARDGVGHPFEKEYFRKDGSRVPVVVGAAVFDDNPEEGVCFVIDLTEPKKLERQFLRAQRMESIGTLAGGIAHDLNNILAPIILSIDLLKMKAHDEETRVILETIDTSAKRGAAIVGQVLSFARGIEGERVNVHPNRLLNDIKALIQDSFPKEIRQSLSVCAGSWMILGDPTQLHQVLLNLCVNARDAMPNGGKLIISFENCTVDDLYSSLNLEGKAGRYVLLTVCDTGTGIPPDVLSKIFDPFFTTKAVDKGTGLGLSTVMGIVRSHAGFVEVLSEVGQGTTFKIYLPAVDALSEFEHDELDDLAQLRGSGETILVVDDEISILSITGQTLQANGYEVLTALNGAEAVAVYAQNKNKIAVVLTDMTMPIMDGSSAIYALLVINPVVKIIVASGLASKEGMNTAVKLGVTHFLKKPYTASALLKMVQTTLQEIG